MKLPPALHFPVWAGLFALAYSQAPLYYSNQNQYFLHGLAAADDGPLCDDWLANTVSPTPVFDALVTFTAKYGHESIFHIYYALLLGVYFVSLLGLFDYLGGARATPRRRLVFAALLMLAHSAALRWASYRLFDADYPCYAQGWLAAQYVLGSVFQPSAFGVFLIAAIHQFVRGRPFLAATCLGAACVGHATYLLPAGILALVFAGVSARHGRWREGVKMLMWSFVLALPVLIHAWVNFRPTTPEAFAEASRILAEERIPHHCQPKRWFDGIAALQVAFIAVAILIVRRTRLFPVLAVLFVASTLLTLVQLATGSHTLALLFPWRASVILLPLAMMIVLTRAVLWMAAWIESTPVKWTAVAGIGALALAGIAIMHFRQGFATNDAEEPLMAYVRANRRPGDVYLLPVTVPKLGDHRGAISSDFKPLPSQKTDKRVIPIDFQRFRIGAGVPIYVDFKAIPYRDVDVLEWRKRVEWNAGVTEARTAKREELTDRGITHAVVPRDRDLVIEGLKMIWEDENYRLYEVDR